jgi:chromosome segregation ATPase
MNLLQALTMKVAHMGRELAKASTTIHHQRLEIGRLRNRLAHAARLWDTSMLTLRESEGLRNSALKIQEECAKEILRLQQENESLKFQLTTFRGRP